MPLMCNQTDTYVHPDQHLYAPRPPMCTHITYVHLSPVGLPAAAATTTPRMCASACFYLKPTASRLLVASSPMGTDTRTDTAVLLKKDPAVPLAPPIHVHVAHGNHVHHVCTHRRPRTSHLTMVAAQHSVRRMRSAMLLCAASNSWTPTSWQLSTATSRLVWGLNTRVPRGGDASEPPGTSAY